MIRPDIRTYHEDWGEHLYSAHWQRDHFLGRSPRQYYLHKRKKSPKKSIRSGILFQKSFDFAGYKKDEIEIRIKNNILTISAQKTKYKKLKNKFIVEEYDVQSTRRVFKLANIASHEKISAHYHDGKLILLFENCCDVNDESKNIISVN